MKFTADRNDLAVAVTNARMGIPANPEHPVRAGMQITGGNEIAFTGSDGDVTFTSWLKAEASGEIVVPGKIFTEVVHSLPDHPVTVESDTSLAVIRSGSSQFRLPLIREEYPQTARTADPVGTIDGKVFVAAMNKVAPAASSVDQNPALHAVKAELSGRTLTLVATDHYRLSTTTLDWSTSRPDGECLIPGWAISKFTSGAEGSVTLGWDDRVATMQADNFTVTSRLIGGKFPSWRQLIPSQAPVTSASGPDFLAALKRAQLTVDQDGTMTLRFTRGGLIIEAGHGNRFSEVVSLRAWEDDDFEAQFGLKYLIDGVTGCGDTCGFVL
ncbi:MAG TPA: DNA polymerase III subunit beta, partial [Puia sp.]|nr:DNA polymerase III subunit beta [Puia sp.]